MLRFISILLLITFFSCRKPVAPPREDEVVKVINDYFYSKKQFPYSLSVINSIDFPFFPPELKQIKVLRIDKKRGSNKTFDVVAVAKGRLNFNVWPHQDFIDTIHLEIKRVQFEWVNQKMIHKFKYSLVYDPTYQNNF